MSAHEWQAPGPHDKRSPCPVLNALANHGYLPRSGENISKGQLSKGLKEGLNISSVLATILTYFSFFRIDKLFAKTLNLDDLNQHNKIEHDVSLTRKDFYFGDNHTIDPELIDLLLNQNIDGKMNQESFSKIHWIRFNHSKEFNPTFSYTIERKLESAGESILILRIIGANTNHEIDVEKLEVLLKHERFPDGWRKADKMVGAWAIISGIRSILNRFDQLEKEQNKQKAT
ncbi:Chloroperoxidase [Gigaspora rosea]|uniref:Chloroperoxidase n=1 Tax=Gigaspora rosea TaxID=44941 RepID=A0A397VVU3_9GLOM|nr:Chloroperoxidase [Gigaspora rosea]CAG8462472.1 16909_t:CDS:2 [Gigaspora rosea]